MAGEGVTAFAGAREEIEQALARDVGRDEPGSPPIRRRSLAPSGRLGFEVGRSLIWVRNLDESRFVVRAP